jgi:hypothetical protein
MVSVGGLMLTNPVALRNKETDRSSKSPVQDPVMNAAMDDVSDKTCRFYVDLSVLLQAAMVV